MTYTITLISGGHFPCAADETITEAGRRACFRFPVACGNGVCERCRGRLVRGGVGMPRKNRTIHAGERQAERVLYCVAQPLSDCEIDVPEVAVAGELPVHETSCQITEVDALSHDVSRAWLRLPAGRRIEWYAGQYLELLMPDGPCPFSIATAPEDGLRDIELHIRHTEDNPTSLEIMAALEQNLTVDVRLPGGNRYINELPQRPVWFICGSTGFAPVKAMIEHLRNTGFDLPVRLFWGARQRGDLYLENLPENWITELADFDYVPVLSEEKGEGYHQGLVQEPAVEAVKALDDASRPLFFLGGSPPMAWSVFDALVAAGVPAENIHSDVFDYAPR